MLWGECGGHQGQRCCCHRRHLDCCCCLCRLCRRHHLKDKNYKLTADNLRLLVAYKKRKGDAAIPPGKAALLARWNEIKHRTSRQCSPNNSKVEEEEEAEEEEQRTGLVFGDDDSEDEDKEILNSTYLHPFVDCHDGKWRGGARRPSSSTPRALMANPPPHLHLR